MYLFSSRDQAKQLSLHKDLKVGQHLEQEGQQSGFVDMRQEGRRLVPQLGITQRVPASGCLLVELGILHIFH